MNNELYEYLRTHGLIDHKPFGDMQEVIDFCKYKVHKTKGILQVKCTHKANHVYIDGKNILDYNGRRIDIFAGGCLPIFPTLEDAIGYWLLLLKDRKRITDNARKACETSEKAEKAMWDSIAEYKNERPELFI